MPEFTCEACALTLEDGDMLKHISQTRHNKIVHTASNQELECENCEDSNVHQLVIVRYGGTDMQMLCQLCLSKEEGDKPSTQYTIQNGSLLKNVLNYYRVRDLKCSRCSSESHLNVNKHNNYAVICDKCIKDNNLPKEEFVSENGGSFLYVLLNISQNKPTNNNKKNDTRKRKVGRGSGKRERRKKPVFSGVPKNQTFTPSQTSQTLRTFKAVGQQQLNRLQPDDERGQAPMNLSSFNSAKKPAANKSSKSNGKTVKLGSKSVSRAPGSKSQGSKASGSRSKPSGGKSTVTKSSGERNSTLKVNSNSKPLNVEDFPKLEDLTIDEKIGEDKAESLVRPGESKIMEKERKPKEVKKESKAKDLKRDSKAKTKVDDNNKPKELKNKTKAKESKETKAKDSKKESKTKNSQKDSKFKDNKKDPKPKGKEPDEKSQRDKKETKETKPQKSEKKSDKEDDHEELEYIPKYSLNKPRLSYDSLDDYFKEMCYHLYLEQTLTSKPITNFYTEWNVADKSLFKVSIPYTEELKKLVSPKFRNLGRLPFNFLQGMFLTRSISDVVDKADKDNVWECFIKDMELNKRRNTIEMLLEVFNWNDLNNFPTGSKRLSLVPCSVIITRVLIGMSRTDNPSFIKMLLGKEPIKQIKFNNRLKFTKDTFNTSQKTAIEHVLNNPITVLQGPPGTGKTSTIYEIILQLWKTLSSFPILVVANSNIAIDNIAEKLKQDKELKILRIVAEEKERVYNSKHHLFDICLHHHVQEQLSSQLKEVQEDFRFGRPVSKNQHQKLRKSIKSITEKYTAQANIILTTTVACGGFSLKNLKKVPVVIMDESTQSSEATSLIPLSLQGVTKFIFVGDDKQLSSFSEIPYLEQSLFERILNNGTYKNAHMLDTQYRMHPKISEFPIKRFYNGLLKDGISASDRYIEGIEPLNFVNYGFKHLESKVSKNDPRVFGYTYQNFYEAELITKIIKDLVYKKNINLNKISVITPYSAQRDLIAETIKNDRVINPHNESIEEETDGEFISQARPATIKTICNIIVSSIDAFQGRETDFIIFSCVRSNKENKIGFVKDERRLNVALTRARNSLIFVGNKDCLSASDKLWNELIEHLASQQAIYEESEFYLFKDS